jgi:hypothetical protein
MLAAFNNNNNNKSIYYIYQWYSKIKIYLHLPSFKNLTLAAFDCPKHEWIKIKYCILNITSSLATTSHKSTVRHSLDKFHSCKRLHYDIRGFRTEERRTFLFAVWAERLNSCGCLFTTIQTAWYNAALAVTITYLSAAQITMQPPECVATS